MIYRTVIRPLLFGIDPEVSHEVALTLLGGGGAVWSRLPGPGRDSLLETTVCGIRFPSPVGLAGGFDKAARALWAWPALGFGFAEVGTVTAQPQPGNPRPRLFRLTEDQALINRLGFNSPGADAVAGRLASLRRRAYPIPLGVNIGRSAAASNEGAPDDYAHGLVATNTTIHRNGLRSRARDEAGGVSGRPLRDLTTRVIRTLRRLTHGRVPIIGVGGVFTPEDAYEKIKAGAALVELYTGLVYGGPGTPRRILDGLRALLDRDGLGNIADAVRVDAR